MLGGFGRKTYIIVFTVFFPMKEFLFITPLLTLVKTVRLYLYLPIITGQSPPCQCGYMSLRTDGSDDEGLTKTNKL